MIGYHYTTQTAWEESIKDLGMYPHVIRAHEFERFRSAMPDMQKDAIWVWKNPLTTRQAWIATAFLAHLHDSFDMVLLEIDYDESDAASIIYKELPSDTVKLSCDFAVGEWSIGNLPIELLINHVPSERIRKVWEGNLLTPLRNWHKEACPSLAEL
jgi:hypothetical protein